MARQIGRLRAWAECAAMAPPWALLRALPLESAVRAGAALGAAAMAFDLYNRDVAQRNLAIAFARLAPAQRWRILRGTYGNFGRMAAEWVHFPELNRSNIEQYVTYTGREHWDDAIRRSAGRGILILTGHFGNFELLSVAHSIYGHRVAIVQRPNRNPVLDQAIATRRRRFGNLTVARKGAAHEVIRLLRDNWMVAIPLDLDTRHGVFVDFFGKVAATNPALARIAMTTGAPVLPAFMVRQGQSAQHQITRHPDQWNWIHRRWKTRPNDETRFY
jgi:KDO2-lipid IV(A) lauroyltransferase